MEELIPLSAEDLAILELECATIAGHTCKVVRLAAREGAPLDVERLRERIAERIALAPALTRRLGGSERSPSWVLDDDFDLARHVVSADVRAPLDDPGLLALVARLFEQRLDRSRPLWRIDFVALDDGGSALIWRIHHSLADGTASVRFARTLLWDEAPDASITPAQAHAAHAADEARRRGHLAGFLRREYARGTCRSPFDGSVGARREVGFAVAPLQALHDAARKLAGATVNDAIVAIVSGAIGRWLAERHGELGTIRVRVPVSLHHDGDDVANHDSFFSVAVPLNEPDPVTRLRIAHAETAECKLEDDAREHERLVHELSGVPPLRRLVSRIESNPRRFALCVSNVPGPREAVSLLGTRVIHLHSIAEIGERHALRVSATSLAGLLCFGLCSDPHLVDRLDLIGEGIEAEARALLHAAGVAGPLLPSGAAMRS
ncbi:MAG: Acyltransferase [Solirubrobacterales bacterium]|nr:Acyltransferase [Solirubrobacterales bacterium]